MLETGVVLEASYTHISGQLCHVSGQPCHVRDRYVMLVANNVMLEAGLSHVICQLYVTLEASYRMLVVSDMLC